MRASAFWLEGDTDASRRGEMRADGQSERRVPVSGYLPSPSHLRPRLHHRHRPVPSHHPFDVLRAPHGPLDGRRRPQHAQ